MNTNQATRLAALAAALDDRRRPTIADARWLITSLTACTRAQQANQAQLADAQGLRERVAALSADLTALIAALAGLGLQVRGRAAGDDVVWSYSWDGGPEEGRFPDAGAAFAAGLSARIEAKDGR